jgi:hypothetical protein
VGDPHPPNRVPNSGSGRIAAIALTSCAATAPQAQQQPQAAVNPLSSTPSVCTCCQQGGASCGGGLWGVAQLPAPQGRAWYSDNTTLQTYHTADSKGPHACFMAHTKTHASAAGKPAPAPIAGVCRCSKTCTTCIHPDGTTPLPPAPPCCPLNPAPAGSLLLALLQSLAAYLADAEPRGLQQDAAVQSTEPGSVADAQRQLAQLEARHAALQAQVAAGGVTALERHMEEYKRVGGWVGGCGGCRGSRRGDCRTAGVRAMLRYGFVTHMQRASACTDHHTTTQRISQ